MLAKAAGVVAENTVFVGVKVVAGSVVDAFAIPILPISTKELAPKEIAAAILAFIFTSFFKSFRFEWWGYLFNYQVVRSKR